MGTEQGADLKPEAPEEVVAITIGMKKNGEAFLKTAIPDAVVFYGLLEIAKQMYQKSFEASKPKIHAPGNIMNFVRNGKH